MMDTITGNVMFAAAEHVIQAQHGIPYIHTVIVTLNGATGNADVTITGFTSDVLDEELTIERTAQ
jgi:flagellar motor protein MotB